jgi:hypothetical protein
MAGIILLFKIVSDLCDQAGGKKRGLDLESEGGALSKEEGHQIDALHRIEKQHMCQEHKKPCFVQSDGNHYHLTTSDLAKWSHLLVSS